MDTKKPARGGCRAGADCAEAQEDILAEVCGRYRTQKTRLGETSGRVVAFIQAQN